MNPILTLLPAAGAAIAFFFSSLPVDDYDTSNGYGPLMPAYKAGVGPSNYEQQVQSNFAVPGRIAFAPIPGASSYALFSGAEFGLFQGQEPWIKSQLEEMNRRSPAPNDTFSVPSIPDIAQAIQIEGLPTRIAFQETSAADGSVPTPKKPATASVSKTADSKTAQAAEKKKDIKSKYAERKNGRVMLTKALVFRGWQKNPEKKDNNEKEEEGKDEKSKADDREEVKDEKPKVDPAPTPAPAPAPVATSNPQANPELVIPPPAPVEP